MITKKVGDAIDFKIGITLYSGTIVDIDCNTQKAKVSFVSPTNPKQTDYRIITLFDESTAEEFEKGADEARKIFFDNKEQEKKYRVIEDKILILPDEVETQTKSGLSIPQALQEKSSWGTVIAVGSGQLVRVTENVAQLIPLEVKVGERVQYQKHAAVPVAGTKYFLIRQENILLID